MGRIVRRSLDEPDEVRELGKLTDIVDSTATASRLGDHVWRQSLAEHNQLVRARLERYLGEEVNTTGDGFLAMFASARAALGCAIAIRDATAGIGLPVRIGVHTGEVELLPGDIGGLAVHAAARVMASVKHRRSSSHPARGAWWRTPVSASSRAASSVSRASPPRSRCSPLSPDGSEGRMACSQHR